MRPVFALVRSLVVGLFTVTQNLLKALWVKPPPVDYVTFDLHGDPAYRPGSIGRRWMDRFQARPQPLDLFTLAKRLERIAAAPMVRGVVFRVADFRAGLSKIEELVGMVERFRRSGKEVVFWTPHATTRELLLLLRGTRLYLAPAGRMDLRGFALETTTARKGLGKLGVEATVFRRGTHKSAGELLSRDGMSDEHRETLDHLLDDLDATLVRALMEGRGLTEKKARSAIDGGPYGARRAEAAGLLDGLCYGDELAQILAPEGKEKARLVPWPGFRATVFEPVEWTPLFAKPRVIAVVPVHGLIIEGDSRRNMGGGRAVGARSVGEALAIARKSPEIRAVVLHINSRGGSALASDLIWREVRRTAEKKPVVAYLDSVAASGGYYVAAGASHILASPSVLTGSIGVLAAFFDLSGLYGRLGVTREVIQRGKHAALGTTSRAPTKGEKAAMDRDLDEVYADFKARVSEGRGLSEEETSERAEGKVYTGTRAATIGLVDELGGFEDALRKARSMAGLHPDAKCDLVTLEMKPTSLLSRLSGMTALPGVREFDAAWIHAAAARPGWAWAVWPFELRP